MTALCCVPVSMRLAAAGWERAGSLCFPFRSGGFRRSNSRETDLKKGKLRSGGKIGRRTAEQIWRLLVTVGNQLISALSLHRGKETLQLGKASPSPAAAPALPDLPRAAPSGRSTSAGSLQALFSAPTGPFLPAHRPQGDSMKG